jgi:RHS repeat-associated protein
MMTCVRPARGGGGGGGTPPPPVYPTDFFHYDQLGSTTLLTKYYTETGTDAPGMYFRYDPYGTTNAYYPGGTAVPSGVAYDTDRLYTGQRWDSTTLFCDYGARFYDPRIAHFLSQDPAGEYTNPYAYVAWNPVMRTDPSGMFSWGAYNIYFDQGGQAYADWYSSWSGGISQGFGGFGGLSGLGAFISSSVSVQPTTPVGRRADC